MTVHPCLLDPENWSDFDKRYDDMVRNHIEIASRQVTSFGERKRRSEANTFGKDLALAIKLDKQEEKGIPPFKQEVEILERF